MTVYSTGDKRNCRNCQQPIYLGASFWWHNHNDSLFCEKSGPDLRTATPDLDEVERVRAAGPALLEALKAINEWILDCGEPIDRPDLWNPLFYKATKLADAAIAKAEGRA